MSRAEDYICKTCFNQIWRIESPYCQYCGRPLGNLEHCLQCQTETFNFTSARSWGVYTGVLRQMIHLFKFAKQPYLGAWFAQHMLKDIDMAHLYHGFILVPVPLHPRRLLVRGFNQAGILCESLSKQSGMQWVDLLYRKTNTPSQTTLERVKRQESVHNQFGVRKRAARTFISKKILLIDDVMTTGSTLNECSRTLLNFGFTDVHALTIATVLKP